MKGELPQLCDKYALKSLDEPITVDWSEDSLKLVESLAQYLAMDDYKAKAMQAIESQRMGIEFKSTNDSIAVVMRTALEEPTDALLLQEARKWYGTRE